MQLTVGYVQSVPHCVNSPIGTTNSMLFDSMLVNRLMLSAAEKQIKASI